jgi:2,3-bisphosphoglycerate-dependent phosphoglycerate mutase
VPPMHLLLIRHAQTTGQEPEAELTTAGLAQAQRLALDLASYGVDAVFSSPFRRAVQTAEPLATMTDLTVTVVPGLRERRLSSQPLADWLWHAEQSFLDRHHRATGGETLHETATRALAALSDIMAGKFRRPAAVSHGGVISAVLSAIDPEFGFPESQTLANPDVFELTFEQTTAIRFSRVKRDHDS